jgi:hypothetical protein
MQPASDSREGLQADRERPDVRPDESQLLSTPSHDFDCSSVSVCLAGI